MAKIALLRPGAIGDIIMSLNFVFPLQSKNDVTFFCHKSNYNILKTFVSNFCKIESLDNLNKKNFDQVINLIGYPINEGYPHKKMSKHLLEYFSQEIGVEFSFEYFLCDKPHFPKKIKNRNYPRYITLQTKTGWSTYKDWWGWQELVNMLKANKPHIELYQIGGPNDPQLDNVDGSFCGDSFLDNISAQAWANLHIGLDSVFNHTTNIIWSNKGKTKSIILFGSTQSTASGYPHNINISLNLPCQPCFKENPKISTMSLGLCNNPANQTYENPQHACMKNITPKMVYDLIQI